MCFGLISIERFDVDVVVVVVVVVKFSTVGTKTTEPMESFGEWLNGSENEPVAGSNPITPRGEGVSFRRLNFWVSQLKISLRLYKSQ